MKTWFQKCLLCLLLMASIVAYICSMVFRQPTRQKIRSSKYNLPLPRKCHMELNEDVIRGRSIFVIGDVHGCLDELLELLKEANNSEEGRQILPIFVGDLINKGPKSAEVLRYVRTHDAYCVRGNHDEALLHNLISLKADKNKKIHKKFRWIKDSDITEEDVDFLTNLPYTISIPSCNAVIVHAGLKPGFSLEQQNLDDLIVMRNIIQDDGQVVTSEKIDQGQPWASVWTGPEHVYFGHDARRRFQSYPLATGLDTGCVYGDELTGYFISGNARRLSIKSQKNYTKIT